MNYRIEKDTFGEIKVPADKFWGAQTQRSKENFKIGSEKMPICIVKAFAILKRSTAIANNRLGNLDSEKTKVITAVCDEILEGKYDDNFPLVVWQTGSGTQSNMNVNEVIANLATALLKEKGSIQTIHPNDDVNRSQSSNDTFPTAMHVAGVLAIYEQLVPALDQLRNTLDEKAKKFNDIVKIGRTHLQDATPLTLGQEISGWVYMIDRSKEMILEATEKMRELAIGVRL